MANARYSDIRVKYLSSYRVENWGRTRDIMGLYARYLKNSCYEGHLAVVTSDIPYKKWLGTPK